MKKYNVEIRADYSNLWDGDAAQDYIEADSEEEAIEIAKDYLREHSADNIDWVDEYQFRVRRHTEWNEKDDEWQIF